MLEIGRFSGRAAGNTVIIVIVVISVCCCCFMMLGLRTGAVPWFPFKLGRSLCGPTAAPGSNTGLIMMGRNPLERTLLRTPPCQPIHDVGAPHRGRALVSL